jgi:hypothetical protein
MLGPATSTTDSAPQRRSLRPYLLLLLVSFPLWYAGLALRGGKGLLDHSPVDQHTRQAAAWLRGQAALERAPDYLEIAEFEGHRFVSFPPVPSLVEVPLVLAFGEKTPNALLGIYLFWLLALAAQFALLRRRGFDERSALLASLAFVFATNLYVTCVRANVWAYGQQDGVRYQTDEELLKEVDERRRKELEKLSKP